MQKLRIAIIQEHNDLISEAMQDVLSLHDIQHVTLSSIDDAFDLLIVANENLYSSKWWPKLSAQRMPTIILVSEPIVSDAVTVIQEGALDYLPLDDIKACVQSIQQWIDVITNSKLSISLLKDESSLQLLKHAYKVSKTNLNVLISGESGTGKEVLAHYIHQSSPRANMPFVAINCAAIPENMLEATLFGYEKGAFTGAYQSRAGKFEQAQHGTLLLDEVSEMPPALQAKLLRVLQECEVERLGGKKILPLDVRIIATTNRHLISEIEKKKFREDLYYRLSVFPLRWKALRERKADILPLIEHLLAKHALKLHVKKPRLSEEATKACLDYTWPGNIRELENTLQKALVLKDGDVIEVPDLFETEVNHEPTKKNQHENDEYAIIVKTLEDANGNRTVASEMLGVSPRTLRYKIAQLKKEGFYL